jgi:ferredoxin-NADP reductase
MSTAVANWPTFLTKLTNRKEVAERTMTFCFDKPDSFTFTPGQFLDITLLNPRDTDSEGNARGFSIASAPYEDFIMVATRLRNTAFKRTLRSAPLGTEVKIEGPFGNRTGSVGFLGEGVGCMVNWHDQRRHCGRWGSGRY